MLPPLPFSNLHPMHQPPVFFTPFNPTLHALSNHVTLVNQLPRLAPSIFPRPQAVHFGPLFVHLAHLSLQNALIEPCSAPFALSESIKTSMSVTESQSGRPVDTRPFSVSCTEGVFPWVFRESSGIQLMQPPLMPTPLEPACYSLSNHIAKLQIHPLSFFRPSRDLLAQGLSACP